MCSFLFTTKVLDEHEINVCNKLLKYRGPDELSILCENDCTFLHNRLSITKECKQPYTNDDIIILFNGEIYNYENENELEFIKECYKKYNFNFAKYLDGEFSILLYDKRKNITVLCTDTFKTKPLWFSLSNGIHVSTYKGALLDLNINDVKPLEPNTTLIINNTNKLYEKKINIVFDINQFKDSYSDIIESLDSAIDKRSKTDKKLFIGLSSGYDSGCIAARLNSTKKHFYCYSVENNETISTLEKRHTILSNNDIHRINYKTDYNFSSQVNLQKYCEYSHNTEYNFISDVSTLPLMYIGTLAKKQGCKVFLSGTGGDEIIGDYYVKDVREDDISTCFMGKFPNNLSAIYPWKNFFNGTMRKYLTKDEYIIGCLGIEARYPFLDKKFIQEFLWLTADLKNKQYKAPLAEYLNLYKFPYSKNEKKGFNVKCRPMQ
jgi:asparagine synthetase B (glutamine-hydrolysing)